MSLPRYQWQPTTAEIAQAAGIPASQVERFDHNTSPIPSSWAAGIVTGASSTLNEYPAASYAPIREAVAKHTGLEPSRVVPGSGADELILLSARAFLPAGSTAVETQPGYPLYGIATAQAGARLITVPSVAPDFAFPAAEMKAAAREADLVWLCVPNNPTGTRPTGEQLCEIVDATNGIVVLDAAYAEFAGDDWTEWVSSFDNLLVLHTLSKAFGLAGARVGYAIGSPDLIDALDAVRPPGSIGSLSVELAVAALADPGRMRTTVAHLMKSRRDLAGSLEKLGHRVLPSPTNFVLAHVGPVAGAVHEALMSEGLVVRKYPAGGPLAEYLRYTVRTPDAHRRLVEALERHLT